MREAWGKKANDDIDNETCISTHHIYMYVYYTLLDVENNNACIAESKGKPR